MTSSEALKYIGEATEREHRPAVCAMFSSRLLHRAVARRSQDDETRGREPSMLILAFLGVAVTKVIGGPGDGRELTSGDSELYGTA